MCTHELLNGEEKFINILIDTGAEANLIKRRVVPEHLTYAAKDPLCFETANGQILAGGKRCTSVKMKLEKERGQNSPETVEYGVEFYEADIKVDAIISYPWLAKAGLGIFPHHKALAMDNPNLVLLFGTRGVRRKWVQRSELEDKDNLQIYNLHLPMQGFDQREQSLTEEELQVVKRNLLHEDPSLSIRRMMVAREGRDDEEEEAIQKLRDKIVADYEGEVLRRLFSQTPP